MKSSADYVVIKQFYEGDDAGFANYLYKHYYYIVDNFYNKNNGVISKKNFEKVLIDAISNYIYKEYYNSNPSRFIHNCFINYEKKYLNNDSKQKWKLLVEKAFNNDAKAREEIFNSYIIIMDSKAIQVYNNNSKSECLYSIDDIKQMIYLEMWIFINRFFDGANKDKYLSRYFNTKINHICNSINNSISNNSNDISPLDNVRYNDSYFVNSIENNDTLDIISSMLADKEKVMLGYLRQGYTYEKAAAQVGLKKQSVSLMNNKIKKLARENNIKW